MGTLNSARLALTRTITPDREGVVHCRNCGVRNVVRQENLRRENELPFLVGSAIDATPPLIVEGVVGGFCANL